MKGLSQKNAPYLFIAPTLILLALFSLLPIAIALVISFTDMDLAGLADLSNISFVGFDNYKEVLLDPSFQKSILNTLFYVIIGVPLVIIISLLIALLINFGKARIFKAFRVIFYMPSVTNVVAVAVVWSYLYNPSLGLLNYILNSLGFGSVPWLQDPVMAKISLIILAVCRAIGLNMIIFIAAIKGISKTYYEAAQIDGAGYFGIFARIAVPMAGPAIIIVFLFSFVWYWNETYLAGLYFGNELAILPLKLQQFVDSYNQLYPPGSPGSQLNEAIKLAGTLLTIVPLLVLYFLLQRWFVEGIDRSGITGE